MPNTYPYNLRGAPSIGGGLPGLPRGAANTIGADPLGFPAKFMFVRADALVLMPDWVTYYRVTATGNGGLGRGSSNGAPGGGGGACSGTANVPERAVPGSPIQIRFTAAAVIVAVLSYLLSAGNGGAAGVGQSGAGGVATGGAVNFNGGNGGGTAGASTWGGGGGAASRAGNGGNAPGAGNTSGGAGAAAFGYLGPAANGQIGHPNGIAPSGTALVQDQFGAAVILITQAVTPSTRNGNDGGGGGAGGNSDGTNPSGGAGFVLLEFW
jgi:hypothetical protein